MNTREKAMVFVLIAAIVGWRGWGMVDAALLEPLRRQEGRIKSLKTAIDDKKLQLRRIENLTADLKGWKVLSLPPDPVVASSVYQKWLIELATKCQLTDAVLSASTSTNQRPVANTFTPIGLDITAKGTFDQVLEFTDRIQNTKLMQRIVSLNFNNPTKDNPPKLTINLKLEGLSFVDAPARKTLFPDPQPSDPSPKSEKFTEQLADLKKQLTLGPPAPTPPVEDPAQFLVLSATFPTALEPGAWFFDSRQNRKQVVLKGKDFQLAGVTGKVADIGRDFVELEIKDKKVQLKIGKPLKTVASGDPTASASPADMGGRGGFGGDRGGRRGGRGFPGFDPSSLTPEQRKQFEERMQQFREMRRQRGGGDSPSGSPSGTPSGNNAPSTGGGGDNPFDLGF